MRDPREIASSACIVKFTCEFVQILRNVSIKSSKFDSLISHFHSFSSPFSMFLLSLRNFKQCSKFPNSLSCGTQIGDGNRENGRSHFLTDCALAEFRSEMDHQLFFVGFFSLSEGKEILERFLSHLALLFLKAKDVVDEIKRALYATSGFVPFSDIALSEIRWE